MDGGRQAGRQAGMNAGSKAAGECTGTAERGFLVVGESWLVKKRRKKLFRVP